MIKYALIMKFAIYPNNKIPIILLKRKTDTVATADSSDSPVDSLREKS